jgi:predicted DNA-binding transcriptional regulator AlpA
MRRRTKTGVEKRLAARRRRRHLDPYGSDTDAVLLIAATLRRYGALKWDELRATTGLSRLEIYRAVWRLTRDRAIRSVRLSQTQVYWRLT